MKKYNLFLLFFACILLFACSVESTEEPNPPNNPVISLEPDNYYFSLDGTQQFLYGRNITGYLPEHYSQILGWQNQSSGRIMRVHITHGFGMGIDSDGHVDS